VRVGMKLHHAEASSIPILLANTDGRPRIGEPLTVGVPLPKGLQTECDSWAVRDHEGARIPAQFVPLERWSDRSIRWALVDLQADVKPGGGALYLVLDDPDTGGENARLVVDRSPAGVVLSTGAIELRASVGPDSRLELRRLSDGGASAIVVEVTGDDGRRAGVTWHSLDVEDVGPVRSSIRLDGRALFTGGARLDLTMRCHAHAGSGAVRVLLTVCNPSAAKHRDGFWELGDAGSVLVKDVSLVVRASYRAERVECRAEVGGPANGALDRAAVHQDSSGGEHWKSTNHVNRHGDVPNRFQGYRVECDATRSAGIRAAPTVSLIDGAGLLLSAAVPAFWQNFPRAIEATRDAIRIGFWPREHADPHELQGGEQKTHECWVAFGEDGVTDEPLAWCHSRTVAHCAPEWYAEAHAAPHLLPAAAGPGDSYQRLVDSAIDGPDSFFAKRERVDEYGWRHFGDIYGDHEAVFPRTTVAWPLVSHYNNQYDPVAGFTYQFMRTGDTRWWRQAQDLARHVTDIDIYHTNEDKAAYNNGLFWHTVHYVDAGKATHRTYPRAKGSNGGGPASEQNYPTGLLLQYLMSGDRTCRDAAVGLARFVVDMDDGRKTVFRWLARGATGLATQSGNPSYHGPGRGAGNSLSALVDGHRATGERGFLDKAEEVLRRCVHPSEDLSRLDLLDAERKWFYTMFLQALGKYLDHKIELGELDAMYTYGRESLLHYARWMAAHEYPILEKPDSLEYPTETWPAQDMRKCEVFQYAVKHAAGEDRRRFEQRAQYFFEYATRTLSGMPTRSLARPVVILLSHGFSRAWFHANPYAAAPPAAQPVEFPPQLPFVPQKARALARAKLLAGAVALLAGGGLLWLWLS
jgi:hypothetical protein